MEDWQQNRDREFRLKSYFEVLDQAIGHADRREPLRKYVSGLYVAEGRKSVEPLAALAAEVGKTISASHQSLLHFVGKAEWSDTAVMEAAYQHSIGPILKHGPIAAWVLDDTGSRKWGKESVGVSRQYCGNIGKVENCQVAVSLSLVNETASLPVGYRLYLPKGWAEDLERRSKVGVPEEVQFKTKPEISVDLIDAALASGKLKAPVLADAGYGDVTSFRDALSARELPYMVGIKGGTSIWLPGEDLSENGEDPLPITVWDLVQALPESEFQEVSWREGGKGSLSSRFASLRVRPAHNHETLAEIRPEEWLLVEWPSNEQKPTHYWLGTVDPGSSLEALVYLAKLRWRIERDYEELKQELGLDHYEGRGWRGFHHHASLCIAAYAFLAAERADFPPLCPPRGARILNRSALPRDYRPRGAAPQPAPPADVNRHLEAKNRS